MINRIYQLEGQDSDLALFYVPGTIRGVQGCFDEAFKKFEDSEYLLNDAADWLKEEYGIERIFIQDYVFTDKL